MRIIKFASPLVTSYRRVYQDHIHGTSLHQGIHRFLTPAKAVMPYHVLLERIGGHDYSSVSQETEKSSLPHMNCGIFESFSVSAVKDCHVGRGEHSADLASSRFYSSAADNGSPVHAALSTLLDEDLFHDLADDVLHHLQEKIEILGEDMNVDGFDSDYADGVLTIRMGKLGTYVINKQTPNRQIWLSSPVSGPGRYDWVESKKVWVYRRTQDELVSLLEKELTQLLNTSVSLC